MLFLWKKQSRYIIKSWIWDLLAMWLRVFRFIERGTLK